MLPRVGSPNHRPFLCSTLTSSQGMSMLHRQFGVLHSIRMWPLAYLASYRLVMTEWLVLLVSTTKCVSTARVSLFHCYPVFPVRPMISAFLKLYVVVV